MKEATFYQLNTQRKTRVIHTATRLNFKQGSLDINGMEKKLTEYAYKPENIVASDTNSGESSPKPMSNDSFFQMNDESQKTRTNTIPNQSQSKKEILASAIALADAKVRLGIQKYSTPWLTKLALSNSSPSRSVTPGKNASIRPMKTQVGPNFMTI